MSFCTNCGKELSVNDRFCPNCGTAVKNAEKTTEFIGDKAQNEYTKSDNITSDFDPIDVSKNKAHAILSYLGILVLVPIIAAPKSKYARFHANQGLALFIIEIAFSIVRLTLLAIIKIIFGIGTLFEVPFASVIYFIIGLITAAISITIAVIAIMGIVNAAEGKAKDLPFISKIHILQ